MPEDSHQVKYCALEHPEMETEPRFKFKVISSFSDPLICQLAESVRIERRGAAILNSKSGYSGCRVPRLRIDLEAWTRPGKK